MERVTTTSDIELVVVQLTKDGRERISRGHRITINDVVDPNEENYIKIRCRVKNNTDDFIATKIGKELVNCYISTTSVGGLNNVPCLIVTIPSNTFTIGGALEASVTTKEDAPDRFPDDTKDTESIFEKTEVYYVVQ